jgi:hypothetical protein
VSARTAVRLTIEVSDGYRRAIARVHGWDADPRGRATPEALEEGFADILGQFIEDALETDELNGRTTAGQRRAARG